MHRLAALELEHRSRHRLEEPAVVGDQDHRCVERAQHLLQPFERLDVEVVRRLVEQQQVGLRRKRARERRARQLAAGERGERPVEVGFGEAEPAHDRRPRGRASRSRRRARAAPAPPSTCAVSPRRVRPPPCRARALAAPPRPPRGRRSPRGRIRGAAGPTAAGGRWSWSAIRRALLQCDVAAFERHLARDRAKQRGLACPVRPGERQTVAPLDLEGDAVEEHSARKLLAEG